MVAELALDAAVEFTVHGVPAPQGSKTVERARGGKPHMREDNPATEPWRNAVATHATAAMAGRRPLNGPLRLEVTFTFPRPQSHYRTGRHAGELRASAPHYCATRPDVDKLLRAVGDALTGVVVVDDARFAEVAAVKRYGTPGARVVVRELAA